MSREDLERGRAKPSHDNNSYTEQSEREWRSWLVPLIVIANVAMFISVMYINNCPKNIDGFGQKCVAGFLGRFSFQPLGENPLFGPSASVLLKMGALQWENAVHGHQQWRLVSCMWLHAGLVHLVVNMISLVFIGIRLEQQFGFLRVGIIYLLSGFGGSVLSLLFIRDNISVGASGALFGLLGAMLSELLTNWSIYSNRAAALFTLIIVIAINLAVGLLPHVDNFAHIGGFLTGFFLGFILLLRPQFGWTESLLRPAGARILPKHKAYQYVYFIIALIFIVAGTANAVQRRKWARSLWLVPIPELCAYIKMVLLNLSDIFVPRRSIAVYRHQSHSKGILKLHFSST